MDVCTVSLRLRVYLSSECYGLVWCSKCPYWKISERQNSTHLTLLKHQNTKTSLYKLSKNHWVIALFKKFGSVRKKLQSTVSLDHPVARVLPHVLARVLLHVLARFIIHVHDYYSKTCVPEYGVTKKR